MGYTLRENFYGAIYATMQKGLEKQTYEAIKKEYEGSPIKLVVRRGIVFFEPKDPVHYKLNFDGKNIAIEKKVLPKPAKLPRI